MADLLASDSEAAAEAWADSSAEVTANSEAALAEAWLLEADALLADHSDRSAASLAD